MKKATVAIVKNMTFKRKHRNRFYKTNLAPSPFFLSVCTKPGNLSGHVHLYMEFIFLFFYDFSIRLWNDPDSVVMFLFFSPQRKYRVWKWHKPTLSIPIFGCPI
jgi:hypothetical protein